MKKLILFQGDSITDAGRSRETECAMGRGYATMVAGELGVREPYTYRFCNRGISGNRIVDLFSRIRADMVNLQPDYISILIGVNGVWHEYSHRNGVSLEKYEIVYELMIQELLRDIPGVKIMIMEPFVLHGDATNSDEAHPGRWEYFESQVALRGVAAKQIAEKYGLTFVPLQEMFSEAEKSAPFEGYWLRDGVHPTDAGHTLIKQAWLAGFEKIK